MEGEERSGIGVICLLSSKAKICKKNIDQFSLPGGNVGQEAFQCGENRLFEL